MSNSAGSANGAKNHALIYAFEQLFCGSVIVFGDQLTDNGLVHSRGLGEWHS